MSRRDEQESKSRCLRGFGVAGVVLLMLTMAAGSARAETCPNEALRAGPSANLPNCRAYEQISPTDTGGQSVIKTGFPSRATADGGALEYPSYGRYANSPGGAFPNVYVARRQPGGWQVTNVSPPSTPDPTPPGGPVTSYDFSADLLRQVLKIPAQVLAPGAFAEGWNLFARDTSGSYSLVNNVPPPFRLPSECPLAFFEGACFQLVDMYTFAGASADFDHVLYEARASLLEGFDELFQSDFANGAWQVTPVGILPNGESAPEGSTAGSGLVVNSAGTAAPDGYNRVANAISADGSRVIFQAASNEGEPNEAGQLGSTQVYDRLGGNQTIELSAPADGATPPHPGAASALFWAASTDGDRVFFTSSAELTTESNTGPLHEGTDLYEYDFNRTGQPLVDLTADAADEAGAQVLGVLDASEDGSYVYFVARAQLPGTAGVGGEPNLYVSHEGGPPKFIATLNEADAEDWTQKAAMRESYVTPSGQYVAFTSINSLPTLSFPVGYRNHNPITGTTEREVYEYSVPDQELICASCNRSGAAPVGPGLLGGVRRPPFLTNPGNDVSQSGPFHQVRAVSDDGSRVFFTSQDPLVEEAEPSDMAARVYQWERGGQGDCGAQGGCISVISGANPSRDAIFLDASENGSDVFLATTDQLTTADKGGAFAVYDARVDGGFPPQEVARECMSEAECRQASASSPASPGAATPGFQGPGNVKPKPALHCGHGKVKRHGKCVRRPKHHKKRATGHKGHRPNQQEGGQR
jgi:hypothetical protein